MYGPVETDGPGTGVGGELMVAGACAFVSIFSGFSKACTGGMLPEGPAAEGGGPSVMEGAGKKF